MPPTSLIKELKNIRIANCISQAEVSLRMEVDPAYLSRLEHGVYSPEMKTLERYAIAIGFRLTFALEKI